MILPIYVYGNQVLKKVSEEIDENYPELDELISNMWDTLYGTFGVGLAAPQVGKSIRLMIIDGNSVEEGYKKVFINPIIEEYYGDDIEMREGCLSIPGLSEVVKREEFIKISYFDENWNFIEENYEGDNIKRALSRMIQHEYDHLEGRLYTDRLGSLTKQVLKPKLEQIRKGNIVTDYPVKFSKK